MISQVAALTASLDVIGDRLGAQYEALRAAALGLAEAVDSLPTRATLWTEYRAVLETLFETAGEVADDGQAALLELVRTPVGHGPDGSSEFGAGGGGDLSGARAAVDAVAAAGS